MKNFATDFMNLKFITDAFNQTGLYPAIPNYRRFQDKGCRGYVIGYHANVEGMGLWY